MIYGDRIRLRAIEREDLGRFVTWLNDPEVIAGLQLYMPLSMADEEKWFEQMSQTPIEQHPMVIEMQESNGWVPLGNCGFIKLDWRNRSGEIGIFIGEKKYWNRGFGEESIRLLLKTGFETFNLNRVFLRVFANNPRAIHVYEKIGFVHEGCMRQGEFMAGAYHDVLIMSVLRTEWEV